MIARPLVVDLNKILQSSIVCTAYIQRHWWMFWLSFINGIGNPIGWILIIVSWHVRPGPCRTDRSLGLIFLIAQILLFTFESIRGPHTVFGALPKFHTFLKIKTIRKLRLREVKWHEQGYLVSEQVFWLLTLLLLHYENNQVFSSAGPHALLYDLPG